MMLTVFCCAWFCYDLVLVKQPPHPPKKKNLLIFLLFFFFLGNRTIVDVNIDALERKPWRHPGADITDFFNYGLDEDIWKCYCNSLVNELLSY